MRLDVTTDAVFALLGFVISYLYKTYGAICIIPCKEWGSGDMTKPCERIRTPVKFVFIHHTVAPKNCTGMLCRQAVRAIQRYHMNKGWPDIGYSFLVGGDGVIYEGRGWDVVGTHTAGHNAHSYGIAFIGDYSTVEPSNKSISNVTALLDMGVAKGWIDRDYKVRGHRDVAQTECPGDKLYTAIQKWKRYSRK